MTVKDCANIGSKTSYQPNQLDKRLLNDYQKGFPLVSRPYEQISQQLGEDEQSVICALQRLSEAGVVSRVGPVVKPHSVGTSTLAAMAVPVERLIEVAEMVNSYPQVNHNYEREHHFNLWFVTTAIDETQLNLVLTEIEMRSGLDVMSLPMLNDYHIDLGFELVWT